MLTVPKFRKKPVVIEALQWDGTAEGAIPIINWVLANGGRATYRQEEVGTSYLEPYLRIKTLEGVITASPWDWVIKGIKDEFYPVKPDIFEATYEWVDA